MPTPAPQRRVQTEPPLRDSGVLVDVVVLSSDTLLFEAIRGAIGERNPVWRARSAEESVDLLLTGRCGVLLVDMAVVSTQPATLVRQIVEQFPDVVVVVAGRREDEALLGRLISDGLVYRFMHKPLTAKRAGMFLNAAIRCHVERRGQQTAPPLLPLAVLPVRVDPRKWLFVAAGLLIFLGLIGLLLQNHAPATRPGAIVAKPAPAPAPARPTRPAANPVLSRARAALQAERYESPPGRNALDLYTAVLLAQPTEPEARAGLEKTIAHIVSQAEQAASSGDRAEAERLLARLQKAAPGDPATEWLATLLTPATRPAEPAVPTASAATAALATALPAAPSLPAPAPDRSMSGTAPVAADASLAARIGAGTAARIAPAPTTARRPVVSPDPLAPRYSNSDQLDLERRLAARLRAGIRSLGRPVKGLPTAGYVNSPGRTAAQEPKSTTAATGAVATLSLPADESDRIIATDPVYPAAALHNRIEGWVELMFTIAENGSVRDIEVVDAQPRGVFESAARQAVGSWQFRPRLANGHPVARRSVVTLRFSLDG